MPVTESPATCCTIPTNRVFMNNKQPESRSDKSLYQSNHVNDWCAGCGDFGILRSLEKALAALQLRPDKVAVFGGIGCSGKTPYYLSTYGIHTLHGRLLPFATGAKLANPGLTVIAVGGDGDGLSIGAGHLLHAGRRNIDLTYILFDNGVYGLTKGQASPTLRFGEQTKAMPAPSITDQLNPLTVALTAGFTWIARGYAYDVAQLSLLIEQAIQHPGAAILSVLQPCPTYNQLHDKDWYAGKDLDNSASRLYSLQDEGYDPMVPQDAGQDALQQKMLQCLDVAQQWGTRIPTGVFFQYPGKPCLLDQLSQRHAGFDIAPPAEQPVCDEQGHPLAQLEPLLRTFTVSATGSRS